MGKQKGRSLPLALPFSVGSLDPSCLCPEMVIFSLPPRFFSWSSSPPLLLPSLLPFFPPVWLRGRDAGERWDNYQGRGAREAGPRQVDGTGGAQTSRPLTVTL